MASQLEYLQQELSRKERDLCLSTECVKRLSEENEELKAQIEILRQEKHSLQLNYEVKSQMIESQSFEIDAQKETCDCLTKRNQALTKEISQLYKKLKDSITENEELRKDIEDLIPKNESYMKKITELERQIQSYQNQEPAPLNDTNNEDILKVMQELSACQIENREAQSRVRDLEEKIYEAKMNEDKLTTSLQELQDYLDEKNEELQSYSALIEKTREENAELLATVEILKLEQVDEKKRGNSVFGEVDDRRRAVEKEYLTIREKYKALKETHQYRLQEMQKLRKKFAMALGLNASEADLSYIRELETKLFEARKEIEQLTNSLLEQKKSQSQLVPMNTITESGDHDDYGYLKTLLMQSRKKAENLQVELERLRFTNVAQANKLIDAEHAVHLSKKTVESQRKEMLKMSLRIEELNRSNEAIEHKENVEVIPGLVPEVQKQTSVTDDKPENSEVIKGEKAEFDQMLKPKANNPGLQSRECNVTKTVSVLPLHVQSNSSSDCSQKTSKRSVASRYTTAPTIYMDVGHNECTQQ